MAMEATTKVYTNSNKKRDSRSKSAILKRNDQREIDDKKEKNMMRTLLRSPLLERNKDLIQRAFLLGMSKSYARDSKRGSFKEPQKLSQQAESSGEYGTPNNAESCETQIQWTFDELEESHSTSMNTIR